MVTGTVDVAVPLLVKCLLSSMLERGYWYGDEDGGGYGGLTVL